MKGDLHFITGPWTGRLAILARPGGNDWLIEEVRSWREAGIQVVVSLLTDSEISELELRREQEIANGEGMHFISFPIPDYGVPTSFESVNGLATELSSLLSRGKSVGVHCRQGIGRSGLIAACLLVTAGKNPTEAFDDVVSGRGAQVPDTPAQRDWVFALARYLERQEIHN